MSFGTEPRRSIRLKDYDYSSSAAYFITLCSWQRRPVFGRVDHAVMHLNEYGVLVREQWIASATLRSEVTLDEWVVMPNHFHAIAVFTPQPRRSVNGEAHDHTPLLRRTQSLSSLVAQYKASATRSVNKFRNERGLAPVKVWQRNYYERIIRDEQELNAARRYIIENPLYWDKDENSFTL